METNKTELEELEKIWDLEKEIDNFWDNDFKNFNELAGKYRYSYTSCNKIFEKFVRGLFGTKPHRCPVLYVENNDTNRVLYGHRERQYSVVMSCRGVGLILGKDYSNFGDYFLGYSKLGNVYESIGEDLLKCIPKRAREPLKRFMMFYIPPIEVQREKEFTLNDKEIKFLEKITNQRLDKQNKIKLSLNIQTFREIVLQSGDLFYVMDNRNIYLKDVCLFKLLKEKVNILLEETKEYLTNENNKASVKLELLKKAFKDELMLEKLKEQNGN